MGGIKKKELKRKIAVKKATAQKKGKKRTEDDVPWEHHGSYAVVTLNQNEEVRFMGQAVLEVLEGSVSVEGTVLHVGSPPTKLSTSGRNGLALTLAAQPGVQRVPRVCSSTVQFSLTAPTLQQQQPVQRQAEAEAGEGEGEDGRSGTAKAATAEAGTSGTGGRIVEDASASVVAAAAASVFERGRFSLHLPGEAGGPTALNVPPDWGQAVEHLCQVAEASTSGTPGAPSAVVVAVCGAKNMGKSSVARLLVNRLLNVTGTVMYLDTDCGQPEFTAAGMLSLTRVDAPVLGPPCTHMRTPAAAHYLGDTSPQSDPELYCASVRSLYRWYCTHAGPSGPASTGAWPPLVVNTHGWIKGIGLDVLAEVLGTVRPTHVMEFQSHSQNKCLPPGLFWMKDEEARASHCAIIPLTPWAPPVPPPAPAAAPVHAAGPSSDDAGASPAAAAGPSRPAAKPAVTSSTQQRVLRPVESRGQQWHAWARAAAGRDGTWGTYEGEELWHDAAVLAALRPVVVPLDDVAVHFLYDQLGHALNGSLVGLAASTSTSSEPGSAAEHRHGQSMREAPPPCLGVGLVRAVDMRSRLLYVLTPLMHEPEVLRRVDTLLVGKADLPMSLLQAGEASLSPYVASFNLSAEGTASGGAKSRNSLERRSLAK